jgi:hypothetical protein
MKQRLQSGSAIVEVIDRPEDDHVLLTVSKERWDDDHVQITLARPVARALGCLLAGDR